MDDDGCWVCICMTAVLSQTNNLPRSLTAPCGQSGATLSPASQYITLFLSFPFHSTPLDSNLRNRFCLPFVFLSSMSLPRSLIPLVFSWPLPHSLSCCEPASSLVFLAPSFRQASLAA